MRIYTNRVHAETKTSCNLLPLSASIVDSYPPSPHLPHFCVFHIIFIERTPRIHLLTLSLCTVIICPYHTYILFVLRISCSPHILIFVCAESIEQRVTAEGHWQTTKLQKQGKILLFSAQCLHGRRRQYCISNRYQLPVAVHFCILEQHRAYVTYFACGTRTKSVAHTGMVIAVNMHISICFVTCLFIGYRCINTLQILYFSLVDFVPRASRARVCLRVRFTNHGKQSRIANVSRRKIAVESSLFPFITKTVDAIRSYETSCRVKSSWTDTVHALTVILGYCDAASCRTDLSLALVQLHTNHYGGNFVFVSTKILDGQILRIFSGVDHSTPSVFDKLQEISVGVNKRPAKIPLMGASLQATKCWSTLVGSGGW